ncbi:hypothetical protein MMC07_000298 [Pseudocyphellaria aurata]|nr:hypothetical protein [Pseudocyphellaria aurata]
MARLNEPTASVETLDNLKRRFVRQNREIARVNSTQSLRIRTLESEISRLLSENIALRERIISLQYEVDKRPGRATLAGMGTIKEKLEAKLTELGGLVQELGSIQVAVENPRSPKRKLMNQNESKRSPDQKNWKNNLTLSEVTAGGDGRLPPIVEDKYFPRKTLDAEELLGIFPSQPNVTDSPDLGPPPVAHFEEGDPVKFETAQGSAPPTDAEDGPAQNHLFANLETRRKRRESTSMTQTKIYETTNLQPLPPDVSSAVDLAAPLVVQPLRSSAKRKLNATEAEYKSSDEAAEGSSQDENGFMISLSRPVMTDMTDLNKSIPAKSTVLKRGDDLLLNQTASREFIVEEATGDRKAKDLVVAGAINHRNALGPKSVNTDPTSPAKLSKIGSTDKVNGPKDDAVKRFPSRNRLKEKAGRPAVPVPKELAPVNTSSIPAKIAPETPASLSHDLLSQVSSEPSAARPHSRDTPPPSDLQSVALNAGVFGTADRAARRPRGSVSYAEPNLRDKMRRPTKDLVDAVGASDRPQHLATSKIEKNIAGSDSASGKGMVQAIDVKEESNASDLWQIPSSTQSQEQQPQRGMVEPASPLGNKSSIPPAELPMSVITNRRRRTVELHRTEAEEAEQSRHQNHPGAGSAILALAAGSQRPRRREGEKNAREGQVLEKQETAKESSGVSPADGLENGDEKRMRESAKSTTAMTGSRSSRRYSTMPGAEGTTTTAMGQSKSGGGGGGGIGGPLPRKRERRKETASSAGGIRGDGCTDLKTTKSVVGLSHGVGGVGSGEGEGGVIGDEATGRAERAAVRRRSMML